jgi:hypothetical protein
MSSIDEIGGENFKCCCNHHKRYCHFGGFSIALNANIMLVSVTERTGK